MYADLGRYAWVYICLVLPPRRSLFFSTLWNLPFILFLTNDFLRRMLFLSSVTKLFSIIYLHTCTSNSYVCYYTVLGSRGSCFLNLFLISFFITTPNLKHTHDINLLKYTYMTYINLLKCTYMTYINLLKYTYSCAALCGGVLESFVSFFYILYRCQFDLSHVILCLT